MLRLQMKTTERIIIETREGDRVAVLYLVNPQGQNCDIGIEASRGRYVIYREKVKPQEPSQCGR